MEHFDSSQRTSIPRGDGEKENTKMSANGGKGVMREVSALVVLMVVAIAPGALAQAYTDVSVEDARDMWLVGVFCLDVRTPTEFDAEHIPGAVNIWVEELETRLGELAGREDTDILVYCGIGGRSAVASGILASHGFTQIFNMLGGLQAWIAAGYPTTTGDVGYQIVSLEEAHAMWEAGAFVIDARSIFGFIAGHIPGAVNISLSDLERRIGELAGMENDSILVYCADTSCSSSDRAAAILVSHGFNRVFIFRGGIGAWREAGYEIESLPLSFVCSALQPVDSTAAANKGDIGVVAAAGLLLFLFGRRAAGA